MTRWTLTRLDGPLLVVADQVGAETYAHFAYDEPRHSGGLRSALDGTEAAVSVGRGIARLHPGSRVGEGAVAELAVAASRIHVFDAASGQALTRRTSASPGAPETTLPMW